MRLLIDSLYHSWPQSSLSTPLAGHAATLSPSFGQDLQDPASITLL